MRCSEPGHRVQVAIERLRGPRRQAARPPHHRTNQRTNANTNRSRPARIASPSAITQILRRRDAENERGARSRLGVGLQQTRDRHHVEHGFRRHPVAQCAATRLLSLHYTSTIFQTSPCARAITQIDSSRNLGIQRIHQSTLSGSFTSSLRNPSRP